MKKLFFVMFVVLIAAGLAVAQTPYTIGNRASPESMFWALTTTAAAVARAAMLRTAARRVAAATPYRREMHGYSVWQQRAVRPGCSSTVRPEPDVRNRWRLCGKSANPGQAAAYSTNIDELRGIMMCLACHDGVVAKGQMMPGNSWEQANNLLPTGVYGPHDIPTLLGNDSGNGNYLRIRQRSPGGNRRYVGRPSSGQLAGQSYRSPDHHDGRQCDQHHRSDPARPMPNLPPTMAFRQSRARRGSGALQCPMAVPILPRLS